MQNINIEEIMQEIRDDIKKRGFEDQTVEFEDMVLLGGGTGMSYSVEAYKDILEQAQENAEVASYRPLAGNVVSRLIKKVNRRLIAFYIEAIVDDQNKFNKEVYKGLLMNYAKHQETDERMSALEKKLYASEKRIRELEAKLKEKQI